MANLLVQPKKIYFGENALGEAMDSVCALGKKALIVTDDLMVSLGHIEKLRNSLKDKGTDSAVYHDVNGEPNDIMVEKGLAVYLSLIHI